MRRIRVLASPIVLSALLAPQPVLGQDEEPVEITCRRCIVGNASASRQLGELLPKNLCVRVGTAMGAVSVSLRLEMTSREEGVIGKYESEAVKVQPGKSYPGSTWLRIGSIATLDEQLFPFEGGGTFIITDFLNDPDTECEGTTHAVEITLTSDDEMISRKHLCLNVER